jgi:hypothetical protein
MVLAPLSTGLPIKTTNLATQNITIKNETIPHPVFITAHSFQSNF